MGTRSNYSIDHSAVVSLAQETIARGQAVLKVADGFVVATLAHRTANGRRTDGVALDNTTAGSPFRIAHNGMLDDSETDLGDGDESWVRVADDGSLERVADADIADGDDLVGRCTTDGDLHLSCNTWTADTALATPGGGSGSGDISTDIDEVRGLRGRALSATTPLLGEQYVFDGTQYVPAGRIHHVALFNGAQPDATEAYGAGAANGTDIADAIEAAVEAFDQRTTTGSDEKAKSCIVQLGPTPPGMAYRLSRVPNIRRSVIVRGHGANPFAPGTLVLCDPGVTGLRNVGAEDPAEAPSGAPGVVVEGICFRPFDHVFTTTTGTYDAGSDTFSVSGVADTSWITPGNNYAMDGMGSPCTLKGVTATVASGASTVYLTDTGDQDWIGMGDAGGGDGVLAGTTEAGWYITIPGAYPTPTRVVSTLGGGTVLVMASAAAADATDEVVRYRPPHVFMCTEKTADTITFDAYATSKDEDDNDINQTVTIRSYACGIDVRNQIIVRDCSFGGPQKFHGFPGAAIAFRGDHANDPASTGVNLSRIQNCWSYHNRSAFYSKGADSNACVIDQFRSNRDWDWSFLELSTLGNLFLAFHVDGGWGMVAHDPPGSETQIIYGYVEGGTLMSVNEGIQNLGPGPMSTGGFRLSRGIANRLQVGQIDLTGAEMHMGQAGQAWRAKATTGAVGFARKDLYAGGNPDNYWRFSHESTWRNHPIAISDTDCTTFKAGSLWFPDGFMVGDDMAFGNLDTDEAVRINAVRADASKNGGPLHRDPKSGYFDSGTVTDSNYATWRKGDFCIDGRITDGAPIRVVTVGGHGALTWAASTNYSQGNAVRPTLANWMGSYFTKTTAGTASSGATEPTWSSAPNAGDTVVDAAGVTWTNAGPAALAQPLQVGGHYPYTMVADADETWSQTSIQFLVGTVKITKTLTAGRTITLPKGSYERFFRNNTGQILTFTTGTGNTEQIAAGKGAALGCDGIEIYRKGPDV